MLGKTRQKGTQTWNMKRKRKGLLRSSYKEAISKLRTRLGLAICPTPEAKNKTVGASALEFFKDPEQNEETS